MTTEAEMSVIPRLTVWSDVSMSRLRSSGSVSQKRGQLVRLLDNAGRGGCFWDRPPDMVKFQCYALTTALADLD
jgi:hypothetical protein